MKLKIYLFFLGLIALGSLSVPVAQAHNPRLVYSEDATLQKPITINNPDISQAFYARLKGWSEYYQVTLNAPQEFYFSTLVPAVKDIQKNISADLMAAQSGEIIASLPAAESSWPAYYEKFGGDNYFKGPEKKINLEAGTYLIKVYNPENEGKYVLVVGQKELFTPQETIKTLRVMPTLKTYFDRSPWQAYFNYVGLFLGGLIFIFAVFILLIRLVVIRLRRR